ncbi:coiled-coil domain-containing protein [Aliarcobacter butzleri]|uniref:hypothetical protein n=1 Tax=Aliarcobacter butzleri TaxID=28197 RepID=UPI002B243204|nr:hypothetical protein [Aliarcobacter butzleri]
MSNFVHVTSRSLSKNSLSSCFEHNVDRKNDGEDLEHLLNENDSLGSETITYSYSVVSSGTYEENLRNYYAKKTKSNNYQDLKDSFDKLENSRLEQLKKLNRKDYQKKHLIEFEIGISEEKANEYLNNGIDIKKGFEQFVIDLKEKFGILVLQISKHFDEGYIDKNNILNRNLHYHLIAYNYQFETKQAILSNFRKKDFRQLQTLAQKSFNSVGLDFKRGISKFQTKKQHLEKNDFILKKQNQELKFLQNDLLKINQENKDIYNLLNNQKNQLKELRIQFEKDSNMYKILSLNIKNLSDEEKYKREEFRQLDNKIKELKEQVKKEELVIENDSDYVNEIKTYFKTYLKENTTKNKDNQYYINDIREFYKSLVENFYNATNLDLKLEELAKLEKENLILKSHLEKAKLDKQSFEQHLKTLDSLSVNVKEIMNKKIHLEEENYNLKAYLKYQNLEDSYQDYIKNLENDYEIER